MFASFICINVCSSLELFSVHSAFVTFKSARLYMKYVFSYLLPWCFRHRYFTHRHTWEDAEKDCREHSAHLSSIISATEQEFINGTCVFVFRSQEVADSSPALVFLCAACIYVEKQALPT